MNMKRARDAIWAGEISIFWISTPRHAERFKTVSLSLRSGPHRYDGVLEAKSFAYFDVASTSPNDFWDLGALP